jgi:hypothetical protein
MASIGDKNGKVLADPSVDYRYAHSEAEKVALLDKLKLPEIPTATIQDLEKAWNQQKDATFESGDIIPNAGEVAYNKRVAKQARENRRKITDIIVIPDLQPHKSKYSKAKPTTSKTFKSKEFISDSDDERQDVARVTRNTSITPSESDGESLY